MVAAPAGDNRVANWHYESAAERTRAQAFKVLVFAWIPIVPVVVMLIVTGALFNSKFVGRHLDLVAHAPPVDQEYQALEAALREAKEPLVQARQSIVKWLAEAPEEPASGEATEQPADTDAAVTIADDAEQQQPPAPQRRIPDTELAAAAGELAKAASATDAAAASILDKARPVALSTRAQMTSLLAVVGEIDDQVGLTGKAIEKCECSGVEFETLSIAHADLAATLKKLNDLILDWSTAKAHQSGAMMTAVNANVILIIVAAGAAFWSFFQLMPARRGGARLGGLAWMRWGAIVMSIVLFFVAIVIPYSWPDVPFMPYKTITLTLFNRTLSHGLLPGGPIFLFWNFVAIGLVAMALYASFAIISAAAWTYDYDHPPVKAATATQRMFVIRNTLYIAALASIASLLAIQTGFAAAASLYPEKIGEAINPTRILINEIGSAIVQANGIGLGLALAASYFPAAGHLHDAYEREKALRERALAAKEDAPAGMFSLLDSGSFGMALRFLAIIAPALIEPISKLIGGGE
jgi:hypothetical protein